MKLTNPVASRNTAFNNVVCNPQPTSNPNTYGTIVLNVNAQILTVASKLLVQVPLPEGATITALSFSISGATINAATPTVEISVSTATTAPSTGNVVSGLALTKRLVNTAESVELSSFTNYTLMKAVPSNSFLYVTTAANYTLATNSIYTVNAQYFLPI